MLSQLPIRVRVASAFAVAMAVVLLASGMFVYARLGSDLGHALDRDLRLRTEDLVALMHQPDASLAAAAGGRIAERRESFAQLLDPHGRVVDSTPGLASAALITTSVRTAALREPVFAERPSIPGLDEPVRLLATPLARGGSQRLLVVGATKENRAEALRSLRTELLIAGPAALVVATIVGYFLAGTGLRAVESMRQRAQTVSAERPGERLPVPHTRDELERLGETLNDMLARLEAALERERAFVADAGHELRTPLGLLRTELDLALRDAHDVHQLRQALRSASDETDRLVQLAEALLVIASTDRGSITLQSEPLPARELLTGVRNRFAWRADDAGRTLIVDVPNGILITGDRIRLEQALANLVDNALRHGRGDIELTADKSNGVAKLTVTDHGPGFLDQLLPRAFERFTKANTDGAGLGLAIVAAIADAHGGRAHAANQPGSGAAVTLELPDPPPPRTPTAQIADRAQPEARV